MLKTVLVLVFVLAVLGETRHVHPKKEQWSEAGEDITSNNDHDPTETKIINIAPKRLSPPHSILFFKSYDPCEEGFMIDYQGICREVWF